VEEVQLARPLVDGHALTEVTACSRFDAAASSPERIDRGAGAMTTGHIRRDEPTRHPCCAPTDPPPAVSSRGMQNSCDRRLAASMTPEHGGRREALRNKFNCYERVIIYLAIRGLITISIPANHGQKNSAIYL
jgi:hypothetical protein